MAMLSLLTVSDYSITFLGHPLPATLEERDRALMEMLRRVDQLHESDLNDR
ncbi:MAG TPA: hypothetical protein VFV89_18705 [Nocardioides sp.]|uniref:hypothetical protein n=1 Tax=Nocardioides sp. TaxID=35761 RepID=UPI002E34E187|nr:hypothetical protein [Nocardioides sp.]HEX5089845.1 hypothetical protein [Nocardioides sp.]